MLRALGVAMDEEELDQLRAMAWITRARMDVLERIVVDYLLFTDRDLAMALEDNLRHAHERMKPPPADDPEQTRKQQLANEAAVRLSDLFARGLAQKG